jgi:hypothetical protein
MSAPAPSPHGSPALSPVSPPSSLELVAELEKMKLEYAKQSERGNALVAEYNKALAEKAALQAEKAALQQKMDRGGSAKFLSLAPKFTGQANLPVEEWLDDVEKQQRYFHIPEGEKVEAAVMLLKGHAAHWWSTLAAKGEATDVWAVFASKLKEMFQPISSVDKARTALDNCVQGSRSVQWYTDQFNRWMAFLPRMDPDDQKHRYITNLNPTIQKEVIKAKAKNLQEAIHAAVTAEAYGSLARTKVGGYYPAPRIYGGGSSSAVNAPMELSNLNQEEEHASSESIATCTATLLRGSDNDVPSHAQLEALQEMRAMMEEIRAHQRVQQSVSAMFQRGGSGGSAGAGKSTKASHVPGVSKADYERCRREGLCLKCKQPGHVARECPQQVPQNGLKW